MSRIYMLQFICLTRKLSIESTGKPKVDFLFKNDKHRKFSIKFIDDTLVDKSVRMIRY